VALWARSEHHTEHNSDKQLFPPAFRHVFSIGRQTAQRHHGEMRGTVQTNLRQTPDAAARGLCPFFSFPHSLLRAASACRYRWPGYSLKYITQSLKDRQRAMLLEDWKKPKDLESDMKVLDWQLDMARYENGEVERLYVRSIVQPDMIKKMRADKGNPDSLNR
jgi:hypothetical protein